MHQTLDNPDPLRYGQQGGNILKGRAILGPASLAPKFGETAAAAGA